MKPTCLAPFLLLALAACNGTMPELKIRPPEAPRWAPAQSDAAPATTLTVETAPLPSPEPVAAAPASAESEDQVETGLASWYGKKFHGRRTANGERFNRRAFTAAHPTLPLGSEVVVTNLETGRALTLRVNDRFPGRPGYVIDVSEAAAEALGFERAGRAQVALVPVEDG